MSFWKREKPLKYPKNTSYPKIDHIVPSPKAPEPCVREGFRRRILEYTKYELQRNIMEKLLDPKSLSEYKKLCQKIEDLVKRQQFQCERLHGDVKKKERKAKVRQEYETFMILTDEYFKLMGKRMKMLKAKDAELVRTTILEKARENLEANQKVWLDYLAEPDGDQLEESLGAVGGISAHEMNTSAKPPSEKKSKSSIHSVRSVPNASGITKQSALGVDGFSHKITSKQPSGQSIAGSRASRSSKQSLLDETTRERAEIKEYLQKREEELDQRRKEMLNEMNDREKYMREEMIKMSEELEQMKLERQHDQVQLKQFEQIQRLSAQQQTFYEEEFEDKKEEEEEEADNVESWLNSSEAFLGAPPPPEEPAAAPELSKTTELPRQITVPQDFQSLANFSGVPNQGNQHFNTNPFYSPRFLQHANMQPMGQPGLSNTNFEIFNSPFQQQPQQPIGGFSSSNRLPKLKLPEFSGDPLEWPEWSGLFIASVDKAQISNSEKMMHLKTLVTGKARDAIAGMGFDGQLYSAAWQTLKKKFGLPHLIVSSQLAKVKNFPFVKIHDSASILEYGVVVSNFVNVLQQCKYTSDLSASSNVEVLLSKLPANLKSEWFEQVDNNVEGQPTVIDFNTWLQQKVLIHDQLLRSNPFKQPLDVRQKDRNTKQAKQSFAANSKTKEALDIKCPLNDGNHRLWNCPIFKAHSIKDRYETLKQHKLCFACMGEGHAIRDCKMKPCGIDGCSKRHNRMLHQKPESSEIAKAKYEVKSSTSTSSGRTQTSGLLQLIKVTVSNGSRKQDVLALCDSGSDVTWVDKSLENTLSLRGKEILIDVSGIHGSEQIESSKVTVHVSSEACKPTEVIAFIHPGIALGDNVYDLKLLKHDYPHLSHLPSTKLKLDDVKMILGQSAYHLFRPLEYCEKGKNAPWAVRTELGWLASGPIEKKQLPKLSGMVTATSQHDCELGEQIKRWWDIESYGTTIKADNRSKEDKLALETLETTIKHNGERYEVGLLWKDGNRVLPNNYASALAQFHSLERRLSKDKQLKENYSATILSDLENGYISKVESPHDVPGRTWYLPHHPVFHPHKPGKVRRVCNAAARHGKTSLNENLVAGPDLLQNLLGIILRFRENKIGLVADIEAMFMQVGVLDKDRSVLRFLWRENQDDPMEIYQYNRHIFGAISSPTCANFTLHKTADDNKREFPVAADAVKKSLYMDDLGRSESTVQKAKVLYRQLSELLKRGGFHLTKWNSNSPEFLSFVDKELRLTDETVSVLGLKWNVDTDELCVVRGSDKMIDQPITQRKVLSMVSSVFDPIGVLAPFTITARKLLKLIWQEKGQSWDDVLGNDQVDLFLKWIQDLKSAQNVTLDRWYFGNEYTNLQLHVFADASEDAICAVAYWRFKIDDKFYLSFIMGKTRVAPVKKLSIPRLELQAALVANRIKNSISQETSLTVEKTNLWSDSTTVIQWLRSSHKKQQTYVANRIAEILDTTSVDCWKHVPGTQNPADLGTRGLSIDEVQNSDWLTGPAWLREEECQWPETILAQEKMETVTAQIVPAKVENIIEWSRFSQFNRLINVVSKILYWKIKHQIKDSTQVELLLRSKMILFKLVQQEAFPDEYQQLLNDTEINKRSPMASMSPFMDSEGLIRSRGRLKHANVNYNAKHPILLTSKHRVVKLYLKYMHQQHHHEAVEFLRSTIIQETWIIGLRSSLRQIKRNCLICKKQQSLNYEPIMADLPKERLDDHQYPFTNTGVDYFGPFQIKMFRRTVKRWCCLFTCLSTRAVHIEIVPSLDADSCLNAITKFIARRGKPSTILSDNGTNFVGASKEFREHLESWNKSLITKKLAQKMIVWKFNPPAAPHFGGVWERLVRSCKKAMYNILGNRRLSEDTLATTMCLVEQLLNSRPLTPVSSDISDLEALTPNHFLLGRPNISIPFVPNAFNYFNHRKQFLQSQAYADMIWTRWMREYMPLLNPRSKWRSSSDKEVNIGELVWIKDDNAKRGDYVLGRITDTFTSSDGSIRSIRVRTKHGEYIRPVVKVIPLEVCSALD